MFPHPVLRPGVAVQTCPRPPVPLMTQPGGANHESPATRFYVLAGRLKLSDKPPVSTVSLEPCSRDSPRRVLSRPCLSWALVEGLGSRDRSLPR